MADKMRVAKWDNVKFVLIACVVIGHMISAYVGAADGIKSLYFFIYSFHMPAFVIVSGMMMKNTIKNKRYEKVFPYLSMGIVISIIMFAAKWYALGKRSINVFDISNVSWYAFAIFAFALITMYLQRFSPVYVFIFSIAVALFVGYDDRIGTYLTLSRIFVFYPFFFAGFCIDNEKLLEFSKKPVCKGVSAVIIIAAAAISFLKIDSVYRFVSLLKGKSSYDSLGNLREYGALLRLAFFAIAFLISFAVIIIIPNVRSVFTTVGSRTLSIYTLHFGIIYVLRDGLDMTGLFKRISPDYYMYLSIVLAVVILFVTALKPVNFAVSKLINPKIVKSGEKK